MKTSAVLLLCMLGAAVFSSVCCSRSIGPDNCCFKFYPGRIPENRIDSYILTDNRCPKPGIILKTEKGSNVCVDPSQSWVKDLIQSLREGWKPPARKWSCML
ncbi:C-C motif chemokine 4-like [Oryzias melastigma]|uniref:C-C motif chemokine n=1 Tax=Oryzias melastigma TaxID=30732 RepID=A0A3B3BBL3_ORYME|nr:C-C motif chemokine 4-like [Oryzias melastigma]